MRANHALADRETLHGGLIRAGHRPVPGQPDVGLLFLELDCCPGEFGISSDVCHIAGGEAADFVPLDEAGVLREKVMKARHGGGDGLQLPVRERDRGTAPGVEDRGCLHRTVEGHTKGEYGACVVGQSAVVRGIEGGPGDEAAHGMGDEDEACRTFVDTVAPSGVVGRMQSPGGQVAAGGLGQQVAVEGDRQAPVVGELQRLYYENGEKEKRIARGTKWFFASGRDHGYWRRVILSFRHVAGGDYEDEAAVAVRTFTALRPELPGCIGIVYDGAFRGVHRDVLARLGLLVVNKQHGSVKPRAYELLRPGRCRHDLWCDQGRIAERILLDDGTSVLVPIPVTRLEHREGLTKSRWYHLLRIPCRHGAHSYRVQVGITTTPDDRAVWDTSTAKRRLSDTERDFHRAEYLQQIPEATRAHQLVYPLRSDAESVHNQLDQSLWNNRMISYGLDLQKVFILGFALSQNATSHSLHLERYASHQSRNEQGRKRPESTGHDDIA